SAYLEERGAAGESIVLAAAAEDDARRLARGAARALGERPRQVQDWASVAAAKRGSVLALSAPLDAGFVLPSEHITVIAAPDLMGSRAAHSAEQSVALLTLGRVDLNVGDAVVHIDHGMAA